MSQNQVKNILKFIEATQSEEVKCNIFTQLGYECFFANKLEGWIDAYTDNIQSFLDWVNVEKGSQHWESLKFNEDRTILNLTGKKVEGCVCAFANCEEPPISLCDYCCKNFQQVMFSRLLGQKVEIEITESALHGGERCSTAIRLIES